MGMSGTPPEVSHREGILLDVTMKRKPSSPHEPTQPFDVRGSRRDLADPGGHSYPESLATSPCQACSAQPDEKQWIGGNTDFKL